MACKQIFSTRMANGSASATNYTGPMLGYAWLATAPAGVPWQAAGTFRNVVITHLSAPGSGKSFVYTLVKNGADTALTVTIADLNTSGSNTSASVTVVAGDVLYWKRVPSGTPTLSNQRLSGEFWGSVTAESGYGGIDALSATQTFRNSVFNQGAWSTGTGGVNNFEVVGAAGTLTAIAYALSVAPGSSKSFELSLYKNGTKQDGAGGTPDTRVTIANAATTGAWSGSLSLAAGDYVYLEAVPTGTPAVPQIGTGIKFVATTDGESQGGGFILFNLPTTGGPYYATPDQYSQTWDATEANVDARRGTPPDVTIRALRVRLGSTVSTGPITFAVRKNGSTSALTATLTSGQQTGSDLTHSLAFGSGETWSLEYSLVDSPGVARAAAIGFAVFSAYTPAYAGSFVAGVTTTVRAARAAAFGLDGNVNVLDEQGKFKIFGNFEVTGTTLQLTSSGEIILHPTGTGGAVILKARTTDNLAGYQIYDSAGTLIAGQLWGDGAARTMHLTATADLFLDPGGDLIFDPAGNDILPTMNYDLNLGALSKKFLTLHAAELWVETLVAQNTIATIGGRILVAPTNILSVDLAPGTPTITVKYNNFANGDRVYMEADGKVEFMAITSAAGGTAGAYTYSVTRNLDGTGADQWYAGDAVVNTGTTGDGWIDLYSISGVLSVGIGPTIVGNVRLSATYNDWAPRWAIGNLNGLYGVGASDVYGVAFGNPSATNIIIDATNGIRIRHGTTAKLTADTSGNLSLTGSLAVSGSGSFAAEQVVLNASGITVPSNASGTLSGTYAYKFSSVQSGTNILGLYCIETSGGSTTTTYVACATSAASRESNVYLYAANANVQATVLVQTTTADVTSIVINASSIEIGQGSQAISCQGRLTIEETLEVGSSALVTPAQITADQNNYSPTGLQTARILRLSSDASRTITGIAAPTTTGVHRFLLLTNGGSQDIVLAHVSGSSSAGNQFILPGAASLTLNTGDSVDFYYDNNVDYWICIAH